MKNDKGLTLLETLLAVSMLAVVMAGGATVSSNTGWMSAMTRANLGVQTDVNQLFLSIERDIKGFAYANPVALPTASYSSGISTLVITGGGTTAKSLKYVFNYTNPSQTTLTRIYTTGGTVTASDVIYRNNAGQYPVLLPFALINRDYDGNGTVNDTDATLLMNCTRNPTAFTGCAINPSRVKWSFDILNSGSKGMIVYVSFRLLNSAKVNNGNEVSGAGVSKAIFIRQVT